MRKLPENGSAWNGSEASGDHTWADWNDTERTSNGSASDLLAENVSAEVLRTTMLGGAEAYVVGLEPENDSYHGNATLWVDTDDYRVHRFRADDGENRTAVDFAGVRFNASVHESTFRPPNASSVTSVSQERYDNFEAAQDATGLELQRLGAEGYAFDEATVVTRNGGTVVAQQYTGEANVTVVATAGDLPYELNASDGESVTVSGENATYVERDDGSVVVWDNGEATRGVVGDLPRDELVALAERVVG